MSDEPPEDDKTCTLYRLDAADGALLYIGIAESWTKRLREHQRNQPWWDQVANVTTIEMASRADALIAEAAAITTERPRHNVVHQERTKKQRRTPALTWVCDGCHEPIDPLAEGFLQVPPKKIWRRRQEMAAWNERVDAENVGTHMRFIRGSLLLEHPKRIHWNVTCKVCDQFPDDCDYWFTLDRIGTWQEVADWSAHLLEKRWFPESDWARVLYRLISWNPA